MGSRKIKGEGGVVHYKSVLKGKDEEQIMKNCKMPLIMIIIGIVCMYSNIVLASGTTKEVVTLEKEISSAENLIEQIDNQIKEKITAVQNKQKLRIAL